MKSLGNNLCIIIVFMILGSSCSQTKRLTEGEILYTGVKKMNIETAKGVKAPRKKVVRATPWKNNDKSNPL